MDGAFSALHLIPQRNPDVRGTLTTFSFNYTFWLNAIFLALGGYLWQLSSRHPMEHGCHAHHAEG